jgi:putrescine importer
VMSYQLGAELLNFGAFIAFMGVNASAFAHYSIRERRGWVYGTPSILGFLVCGYIWLSLSPAAKIAGGVWLAAGLGYGALRGKLGATPTASSTR